MPVTSIVKHRGLGRALGRLLVSGGLIAGSVWLVHRHFAEVDLHSVGAEVADLAIWQWAGAALATLVAFIAVAGQEREIVRAMGLAAPRVGRVGAAAAAVSQTLGFGPVIGAILRRRLRPDLTVAQSVAISGTITLAFFAGIGLLGAAALILTPEMGLVREGVLALVGLIGLGTLAFRAFPVWPFGLVRPAPQVVLRLLVWIVLDVGMLCLAFHLLLPQSAALLGLSFLPVFILALAFGLVSGSPAGAGPFEVTVLAHLPMVDAAEAAAAIVAFRLISYVIPAVIGAGYAVLAPGAGLRAPAAAAGRGPRPGVLEFDLYAAPRAELQLCRAGTLSLRPLGVGAVWLGRQTPLCDLRVGDPVGRPMGAPLDLHPADLIGGLRPRFCYKIGGRTAALARASRMVVLPYAQEAVLCPTRFTLGGPARAGLRRKLNHAARAGIAVSEAEALPLPEMEAVHRAWLGKRRHERGFSMGRWGADYVRGQRVFLARDAQGQLVAWISFHACRGEWVLDLVRYRPEVPDGTLYALVVAAIDSASALKVGRLSLAAVLQAGGHGLYGWGLGRAAAQARGLHQFKAAFRPRWEPRYLAATSWPALALGLLICTLGIHRRR